MAEILKEWLTERLQQPIKWEAQEFGHMMKNGYIIAGVLLSYHVITDEKYFLIRPGYASDDIKSNWKYLTVWLHELGVYLPDSEVVSVQEGKGSTLLRLFYQLFLHLDKRDRTNFIKRERQMVSNLVEKCENRFRVDKVDESEESFVDDLSKPLLNERHYIDWQKKKAEEVKETYDYIRHKYKKILGRIQESKTPIAYRAPSPKKLTSKEKCDIERFAKRYPCKFENYSYEELLNLDEQSAKRESVDHDWAKNYVENLNAKINKKVDSEVFQKEMTNLLSQSLWDTAVAEEETKIDIELAKKVMKLSQFEKQMCTQLLETKQQARNVARNRMQAEREYTEQREHQFHQFLDNFKEQIHMEFVEIYFEKNRQNILHKRLYAEKMKRKRQHYYDICYETMLAIVDYATKYGHFKRLLENEIPDHFIHEWKNLYFKHQPIYDILNPMEDLLKEHPLEEEPVEEEEEEIIRLELDRQEVLNNSEFYEYHNYLCPWLLDLLIPNFDSESEDRKYEYLGNRILGHLVYTLLEMKYPYPPPRLPAALPNYKSKAIMRGLPDKAITVAMQTLLNHSKVHVVRLENTINFCLRKFKNEMIGCVDIDLTYDKFIAAVQEEEDKDFLRALKGEDEIFSKSSEACSGVSGPIPPNTKQTQTPKTLPEEHIKLSNAAELGKYAYEALSVGNSLTDHLISAMIVEYLKDIDDINGFVIINYPNTYREAQILEETFSGREPPPEENLEDRDDIYLEESIITHRRKEKDPFKDIRISRIVNDPHKKRVEKPFISYFNTYIRLKETEDILQEYVIWDLNEENSELLDRFYAVLGINYSMYYEVIEKDLLALMCKYIIGDLKMPLKSFSMLFGEGVLSLLDFPSSEERKTRSKVIKPEASMIGKSKDKLRRGSRSKSNMSNNGLEIVKPPVSNEEIQDDPVTILECVDEEVEDMSKTSVTSEDTKILAGEEEWDYGELPIAESIGISLATCWEQIEKAYIHDIQELFFSKRLQMNCLIPYTRFIKDKMEQIITLPSYKQDLVSQFQSEYNNFEDDWRDVNMTKNEWHCRLKELQSKLYRICDERKLHAEQQRMDLICDNWAMEELTSMANIYISCMQAELNRSFLTFQALHDFYYSMIKHLPPNDRLSSKELVKISRESEDGKRGAEDKVFKQLKHAFLDMQQKNVQIDYSNNPFNLVIENNVKLGQKMIKDINDHYRSVISRDYSEIAKAAPSVKKKEETSSEEIENAEEIFKQNALKCIEEWIMGINGEMFRLNLRLLALQYKCYHDMKLFNDQIFKAFTDIQNDINAYYMNEIKSVDRLCKYLQLAVENGRKVPESLVLVHDTFIIDPNLLQFAPPEPSSDWGAREIVNPDIEFKVGQLARLRSQFKLVAPTGLALQQAFIYLLQDFIFFGKECCEGPLLPEIWKRVDPEQIYKLVYLLFGETAYVDWRDFLIYCLNLRCPTSDELLEQRRKYRCKDLESTELIERNDFIQTEMWFDSDFELENKHDQLRLNLIKHFLFELYETSENKMNYPALLLAFCKNINPIEGFAMALALALGKKVCFSLVECEEVICNLIKIKKYRDESLACAHRCTEEFLDTLITNVINLTCGTTLSEIVHTEPAGEKVKGKKKDKKGKLHLISQSARDQSTHKKIVSATKMTQSATNVSVPSTKLVTYICPPCSEDGKEEVKPEEKEEVEEEHKIEAQPNPTLIYAISQEVIWKVLKVCMPWHFDLIPEEKPTPYVEEVKQVMKELETNTESGDIYISQFVAHPKVCKIINKVKRFTALSLVEELQKVCHQ